MWEGCFFCIRFGVAVFNHGEGVDVECEQGDAKAVGEYAIFECDRVFDIFNLSEQENRHDHGDRQDDIWKAIGYDLKPEIDNNYVLGMPILFWEDAT